MPDGQQVFSPQPCVANSRGWRNGVAMLAGVIGQNIKAARKSRGLSLEKLAARCDPPTSYQQLSRLEKGDRSLSIDWIERIATALGMDPLQLIVGREVLAPELNEQVANEIARTMALVAREGDPAEPGTIEALSLLLQELTATFLRHPQAYRDATVARPVIDLAGRRFVPSRN